MDFTIVKTGGVCYLAKIRILKQTQRIAVRFCFLVGVCYLAKIRILKQITTMACALTSSVVVFVILQRYEF